MEIKTCEQYVLERLERAENDIESLKNILEIKDSHIVELTDEINNLKALIRRRCSLDTSTTGGNIITVDAPWEEYDPIDYNMVADVLKEGQNNA